MNTFEQCTVIENASIKETLEIWWKFLIFDLNIVNGKRDAIADQMQVGEWLIGWCQIAIG